MKKFTASILTLVFVLTYVYFFLSWPGIDYKQSHYTLLCRDSLTDRGGGKDNNFVTIPGSQIKMKEVSPGHFEYTYTDRVGDIAAKLICGGKEKYGAAWEPEDTNKFYQGVSELPILARAEISGLKPSYGVLMLKPVYDPTWTQFLARTALLVFLASLLGYLLPKKRTL